MPTRRDKLIQKAKQEAGKWLATATGGFYFLEGQNPRDITIVDVALGLARKCRYSGNIRIDREHYSVAEHSDLMADHFEKDPSAFLGKEPMMLEDYLKVKLHDATEFVFPDVPTPLKDMFPMFRTIEGLHDEKIESAFLPNPGAVLITKKQVKELDIRIRSDERRFLIAEPAYAAGVKESAMAPLGVNIRCMGWQEAAWTFLEDFVRAVDLYPARDPENQQRALEHRVVAARFLANNPRPPSREELLEKVASLEAEVAALRAALRTDQEPDDAGMSM